MRWSDVKSLRQSELREWFGREIARRSRLSHPGDFCDTTLLSYPRSGNHLARMLIETEFNRPTLGAMDSDRFRVPRWLVDCPIFLRSRLEVKIKDDKPIVIKRHDLWDIEAREFLVFLLRDPVEAILSEMQAVPDKRFDEQVVRETAKWTQLANTFVTWPEEARLLVSYQTLTENPALALNALSRFFGAGESPDRDRDAQEEIRIRAREGLQVLIRPGKSAGSDESYAQRFPKRADRVRRLLLAQGDLTPFSGHLT